VTRLPQYTPVSHRSGIRMQLVIAWKTVPPCRRRLVNSPAPCYFVSDLALLSEPLLLLSLQVLPRL
jgi:hypothetical protein